MNRNDNRNQLKAQLHQLVCARFEQLSQTQGLTKEELAERLGQNRVDLERMLRSPQYWTLDILADLLHALDCHLETKLHAIEACAEAL